MSLWLKLLAVFALTVAAAVSVMVWGVERYAQRQFQESDQQRVAVLVEQARRELVQRGAEVSNSVQSIADAESTLRMVLHLYGPQADPSLYANDARGLATPRHLDFLELVSSDGTLISSAHWPERVGHKNEWVTQEVEWNQQSAFLDRVELPSRVELGLLAVRMVRVGDRNFYIIGGQRLDSEFLRTLALPTGMRALLYRNLGESFVPAALSDADGPLGDAEPFAPIIESLKKQPQESGQTIRWTADNASSEQFVTLPLTGRSGEFLGALLLGSAQGQLTMLVKYIRGLGLATAAAGIFLGIFMSWWISARVTGPLARLENGIHKVTAGDWSAQVLVRSSREVKRAVRAFNKMTSQLVEMRSQQLARERISAWRGLAGQVSAELTAASSPLQVEIENLEQTRQQASEGLDENSTGSLTALREQVGVLQTLARRLGEFALIPAPRLQATNVNEIVRAAIKLFEPQFRPSGRPPVTPELFLDPAADLVRADPDLLQTALENLLRHVLADMPAGGALSIHTRQQDGMVRMVMSDTGQGFQMPGENRILPAHSGGPAKVGLDFLTVQAIVNDMGGRISVESVPKAGITVFLDLPMANAGRPSSASGSSRQAIQPKLLPQTTAQLDASPDAISEPTAEVPIEVDAGVALDVSVFSESSAETSEQELLATEPHSVPGVMYEPAAEAVETKELPVEARLEIALQEDLASLPETIFQLDDKENGMQASDMTDDSQGHDSDVIGAQPEESPLSPEPEPEPEPEKESPEPDETAAEPQVERTWPSPLTYR